MLFLVLFELVWWWLFIVMCCIMFFYFGWVVIGSIMLRIVCLWVGNVCICMFVQFMFIVGVLWVWVLVQWWVIVYSSMLWVFGVVQISYFGFWLMLFISLECVFVCFRCVWSELNMMLIVVNDFVRYWLILLFLVMIMNRICDNVWNVFWVMQVSVLKLVCVSW